MRRLTDLKSWHPVIWLILFPILTALAAGSRVADSRYQWPQVTDHGAVAPLDEPALLAQPLALIWRPVTSPAPLAYQPLDSGRMKIGILSYSDVNPRRWQAAPAELPTYHVMWLEQDNRLRSALVDITGETVRGPIDLASGIRPDFVTSSLSDGRLLVLWTSARTAEIGTLIIDSAGRPGPIDHLPSERIAQVAAGLDRAGMVHLAWLTSPTPDNRAIYYRASSTNPVTIDAPTLLDTFTLAPSESITAFRLGLDDTHGYLFWGTTTAAQPDVERVRVLAFPLDSPADVTLSELVLSDRFTPSGQNLTTLHVGRIAPLAETPSQPARLRWPRPAPGQQAFLPLAVALRTPEGWRPAVVYYQNGEALGFQIVAPLPADAGPPGLLAGQTGELVLAWTGLNNMTPHLYTAHTSGKGLVSVSVDSDRAALRTLAGVLAGIPLGLLWLILPICVVLLAPANTWTLPLTLAVYGAGKLVWPATLFTRLPPLLAATGIEQQVSANWVIGSTVLLIGLAAGGAWYLAWWLKRPYWQNGLVYPLVDMALTWVIFGANVFS
jgi:hypothetical protein